MSRLHAGCCQADGFPIAVLMEVASQQGEEIIKTGSRCLLQGESGTFCATRIGRTGSLHLGPSPVRLARASLIPGAVAEDEGGQGRIWGSRLRAGRRGRGPWGGESSASRVSSPLDASSRRERA